MDLYEAMYTTRAMRRVKPDPIPEDVIGRIFDAAVRGPSGGNRHTFRFLTVTDKATMEFESFHEGQFTRSCFEWC